MGRVTFDLEVLQSFSTGVALGSYARAADRLGRSTSAVSAQLKKLESQAGTALFRKAGRGLELTEAGETMLVYARRLLELNEEAATAVRTRDLQGSVRLGLQEDFGETLLPGVLGRFARAHPNVRIEACVARSAELHDRLALGRLDLVLAWDAAPNPGAPPGEPVISLPLHWIGPAAEGTLAQSWWGARCAGRKDEPLPLVLLEAPCPLRSLVVAALDRAGIPWRHAFASSSLAALWAATAAGLGLSVRTPFGLPAQVRVLECVKTDLPAFPEMTLAMHRAHPDQGPAVQRLAGLLVEAVRQHATGGPARP